MPFSRKAFSLFSSSSTSTSPSESTNARKIYGGGRRLTRVRKLRHVGDDEVDLQHPNFHPLVMDERSKSMPVSPDNYKNSESRSCQQPCHWSKSAGPQPLPLPELNTAPKQNLLTRVQGDASIPAVIRSLLLISVHYFCFWWAKVFNFHQSIHWIICVDRYWRKTVKMTIISLMLFTKNPYKKNGAKVWGFVLKRAFRS